MSYFLEVQDANEGEPIVFVLGIHFADMHLTETWRRSV